MSFLGTIAEISEFYPEMRDIPDTDAMTRKLAELKGVPASLLNTQDDVDALREAREQQAQQERQLAMMQQAGAAAEQVGKGGMAMQEAGIEGPMNGQQ